ncbi:N-acetylmuramoyl-L-alanine amidase [Turicibacter sanguinis]|uniref:N-acetylmuramoyl-L-alanine amidase n=1 Tax=Turicibacter sanguinis TaxID=154288 RepID=UPI0018A9FBD7|nr:N-acetylmuramoyl-L-alanine amidase [Turicibacter sanguinis]MDB8553028.1 N-acetylmuramoyl-L-alanine amidase [Turicibacter sanguinis]
MTTPILVLDAGHGLKTPGKQTMNGKYGIIKEWELNNKVLLYIMEYLKDYVITIYRTDDPTGKKDINLLERVKRCNAYGAVLFFSIHHNAGGGTGIEVYWHTKGTQEDKKIAEIVAPKLAASTGMKNRGVKQNGWTVLTCKATAILVEGGFMDTTSDYEYMCIEKGQRAYAKAIADSVIDYLGLEKKGATPTTPTVTETKAFKFGSYGAYVLTTDDLNIRKERNHISERVGTIPKGTKVKVEYILGVNNSKSEPFWGSVYTSYGNGFINLKYTKPIE